jgi:MoaA/NifB/PqqE/SkfB family radical SAM enzyme
MMKVPHTFKRIYIEITNVCNLNCTFCPATNRTAAFMTIETFQKILEQIAPFTHYLYFHVKGEPLLHPELGVFLDLCHEKGFQVHITTNGTLLREVGDQLLLKPAIRQINFSLHSFDGNESGGSKDAYLNDILSFVHQAAAQTEIITALRLWNLDEKDGIAGQRGRNLEILRKIEQAFHLPYPIEGAIQPNHGIKIADKIFLNQDYQFEWPALEREEDVTNGFCYGLKTQAAILVDGTVVPCCLDGDGIINLGNIHQTPFSEIIAGERATRIYQGFARREAVEPLCRRCGFRKRFYA